MASGISSIDIAVLQRLVDAGDAVGYWRYLDAATLRETGQHDPCAVLASQVVWRNAAARWFAAAAAAGDAPIDTTPEDGYLLQLDVVKADLQLRREELGVRLRPDAVDAAVSATVGRAPGGRVFFMPDGGALSFMLESVDWRHAANDGAWRPRA